jgi:hypothetical protein
MFRSNWLHNVLGMARSRKDRRCQAAQQRNVRLMLEPLEDRITPALKFDPHVAVANALASETATNANLIKLIDSFIVITGGQVSSPGRGNGSTTAGQNDLNGALAALYQDLVTIAKEWYSANIPSNQGTLLSLQIQQVLHQQLPQQAGQSVLPPPNFASPIAP